VIARAPGKVVLSGAYAVLHGAPALVTAVDRYVVADTSRPADFIAPEVTAALGSHPPPWFDASALRQDGRKLGLGSSAAIVVASLAAVVAERDGTRSDAALRDAVFGTALRAHREAQGGGSGVDVASSAWGGVIAAQRSNGNLDVAAVTLPDLVVQVWSCAEAASTAGFLARVRDLERRDGRLHRTLMEHLIDASERARAATTTGDAAALLAALADQSHGLDRLGGAAGIPIVTDAVRRTAARAAEEGAVFMPAGAGGGDIATFWGTAPPSAELDRQARALGLAPLDCRLGARGVHLAP
jgi:phosphomevalonate kinase